MSPIEELATPGRAAVLTMELQRGVVGDLASMRALADVVTAEGIPKRMAELLEGARRAGIPVIHCRAAFRRDRAGSYFNIPMVNRLLENPDHLEIGTAAAEVIPELGPEQGDLDSVRLHGMSPFHGTDLDTKLRSLAVETVVVTGVSLNVGIQGVVIEALNHGYHVVLVRDCVAGVPPAYAKMVLENSLAHITTPTSAAALLELWSCLSSTARK
jgi:nicotinamidase-related amidase